MIGFENKLDKKSQKSHNIKLNKVKVKIVTYEQRSDTSACNILGTLLIFIKQSFNVALVNISNDLWSDFILFSMK